MARRQPRQQAAPIDSSSIRTKQNWLAGAAVSAAAALVYANALRNGLVWDDPIVLDRQLLAFRSLRDLVFLPRNIPQFSPDYYRPLTIVTYLLDRWIGGVSPFMFHFSVVLFHVIATFLVFRLAMVLFARMPWQLVGAAVGAGLFAVHPIHAESVAWGAGRSDVLACLFSLAAALVYLNGRPTWPRALAATALVLAATLAKETAVACFILVPASDMLRAPLGAAVPVARSRAERRRRTARAAPLPTAVLHYIPFAAGLLFYLALRRAALGDTLGPGTSFGASAIPRVLAAVGVYLGKLVLPVHQSAYISELPEGLLACLIIGAALVAILIALAAAWRRQERLVVFLLLWLGLTLAPSLMIVFKIPTAPVAERYLYVPSAGFCLLVGWGVARLAADASRGARVALSVFCVGILVVAAIATVQRNLVWRDNLSLWQDTVAKNTTEGLPARSLGTAYQQLGDAAKAYEYFQIALQRHNEPTGLFTIYNNLGSLAMTAHKLDEAERYYRAALASNPQTADALFNLGLIALTRANDEAGTHESGWKREQALRARKLFEQAEQLSPLDPDIQVGLGQTLSALDENTAARSHFERALQLGLPPTTEASVRRLLTDLK